MEDFDSEINKEEIEDVVDGDDSDDGIAADVDFQYNIDSFTNAVPALRLIEDFDRNIIVIPDFQRPYVWNKIDSKTKRHRPSLFIDSILLGLPIPPISIYKDKDAREEGYLIDGRQRIMTMSYFKKGKFEDGSTFSLKGESISDKWKGKTFDKLEPELQERFIRAYIPVTYIRQLDRDMKKSPGASSIYLLFDRLNSGGYALHSHEKRGVLGINNPKLLELCKTLYDMDGWRSVFPDSITDFTKRPANRTLYNEYIFRAIAFKHNYKEYGGNLTHFLDQFMMSYDVANNEQHIIDTTKKVIEVLKVSKESIGKNYFKPNGKFNVALFDSIFVGTYTIIEEGKSLTIESFVEKYNQFVNEKLYEPINKRSGANRVDVIERLDKAINIFRG